MSVLDLVSADDCRRYLETCRAVDPALDVEALHRTAMASIRHYRGDESNRHETEAGQQLQARWYASINAGRPDYSVYSDPFYVADVWACWIVYSRGYLKAISKVAAGPLAGLFRGVRTVCDLGCGFGYTTGALKELFPGARVFGTNLEGTAQYAVAAKHGERFGFSIVPTIGVIGGDVDVVFASEYFEHIHRPVEHLAEVLLKRPRCLIVANSFGAKSIGHFPTYAVGRERVPNKVVGRRFNALLRGTGHQAAKLRFWNNRPAVWIKAAKG